MRQGPDYYMPADVVITGHRPMIVLPLELEHQFETASAARWTENKDGTFTITLFDKAD